MCRISEGLAALARGVGSLVPAAVLLHILSGLVAEQEDLVKGREVRHNPEVSRDAGRTAGDSLAGAGETCSVRAEPRSPCVP